MISGPFESFYQSSIQHPLLLWIANLLGTAAALLALRSQAGAGASRLRRFILFWALISMLDAWLSANWIMGLGRLDGVWSSVVPFCFVWAGDFRIFLAMELFAAGFPEKPAQIRWWRPVLACFVVPLLAGLLTRGQEARVLFFVYEALFLGMITLYGQVTGTAQNPAARRTQKLSWIFYSLWVSADGLILFLPTPYRDLGFALRVFPNAVYYGAFGWVLSRR